MQLLFVLIAAMLLPNKVLGKPYQSQELVPGITEETQSGIRGKRDASSDKEYLIAYCPNARLLTPKPLASKRPCVKGSISCLGAFELVCDSHSFACLSSITTHDQPICVAEYAWVNVNVTMYSELKEVRLRRTIDCHCAK